MNEFYPSYFPKPPSPSFANREDPRFQQLLQYHEQRFPNAFINAFSSNDKQQRKLETRTRMKFLSLALGSSLRSWWMQREPRGLLIRTQLGPEQRDMYDTLREYGAASYAGFFGPVIRPTNLELLDIVVTTNHILMTWHCWFAVELVGAIANLMPADQRALFIQGAFIELDAADSPIKDSSWRASVAFNHHKIHSVFDRLIRFSFYNNLLLNDLDSIKREKLLKRLLVQFGMGVSTGHSCYAIRVAVASDNDKSTSPEQQAHFITSKTWM
jgi:hypothetical protein